MFVHVGLLFYEQTANICMYSCSIWEEAVQCIMYTWGLQYKKKSSVKWIKKKKNPQDQFYRNLWHSTISDVNLMCVMLCHVWCGVIAHRLFDVPDNFIICLSSPMHATQNAHAYHIHDISNDRLSLSHQKQKQKIIL